MTSTNISRTDAVLIAQLQKNARVTNKALARAAGIAESTCLERVRSLQQRGVIRGFHARVDQRAIGREIRALISVRLQPKTTTSVLEFAREVAGQPATLNVWTVSGADDFVIEVAVSSVDDLRLYVLGVITSRPDVADSRTSLVYAHDEGPLASDVLAE